MDETTPVINPTFLEKVKANKKEIITRVAIVTGAALGIFAAAVLLKKAADDESNVDYIIIEEVPQDLMTESIPAE